MKATNEAYRNYKEQIFNHIPLYQTRLVKTIDASYEVREQVKSPKEVFDFLADYFADKDREHMIALFLDTANTIIGMTVLSVGNANSAYCDAKAVFRSALLANAQAIILAHNHPSGNPEPSRQDISVTEKVKDAGDLMDIPIHDHLIFAEGRYTSLAQEGYF